jgi:hypothetical protein
VRRRHRYSLPRPTLGPTGPKGYSFRRHSTVAIWSPSLCCCFDYSNNQSKEKKTKCYQEKVQKAHRDAVNGYIIVVIFVNESDSPIIPAAAVTWDTLVLDSIAWCGSLGCIIIIVIIIIIIIKDERNSITANRCCGMLITPAKQRSDNTCSHGTTPTTT